jgi:AcrR family transcriptional regulator
MPTPFTPDERERVRATLLEAGHRFFADRGLAKTPLKALTDAAGVAKSTFYAFFPSKEDLCLALLERLGPEVERRVLAPTRDPTRAPADALAAVVAELRAVYGEEPLLRRLLAHPDDLARIAARVGPDALARKTRALAPLREYVAAAQGAGALRDDVTADTIVAALQGLLLLELHTDRLGEEHERVVGLWTGALARHLTTHPGPAS